MASKVYFMDFRTTPKQNLLDKLDTLLDSADLKSAFSERDLVAVKIHFGEAGNTAYLRPIYVRKVVETIKKLGGKPFLTDANTLYSGARSDAPEHLITAIQNGFPYSVIGAPIVIADGLRGRSEKAVPVDLKQFKEVYIGREIVEADALVSVAHFKGHELSGFGGAIKNMGMGCASRRGKMAQHADLSPKVTKKKCIGCGDCVEHCSQDAISVEDEKASIDSEKCIGCGECILVCPNEAVSIRWSASIPVFLEKMIEYTVGVIKGKEKKTFYVNFITDVSPACDCHGNNDAPIVRNIGVLASRDPVAIDQACVDMVNQEPALPGCCLETNTAAGEDKFKGLYPKVDWEIQLDYAQQLGLGSRTYVLETI